MKVMISVFGHLSKNGSGGGLTAYYIAKKLENEGALAKVLCTDFDRDVDINSSKIITISPFWKYINYGLNLLLCEIPRKLFGRRIFAPRPILEWVFDVLSLWHLKNIRGDILFVTKTEVNKALRLAKSGGMIPVLQTIIPHPRFNKKMIDIEQDKFGIPAIEVYGLSSRVKRIESGFEDAEYIIMFSQWIKKIYGEFGVVDTNQRKILIPVNTLGVDITKYYPQPKPDAVFRVMHASHMNLLKGVPYLIEAWRSLNLENAELMLCGSVGDDIKIYFDKYGLPSNTILTGRVNMTEYYKVASVFVSPGVSDNGPSTALEAMASEIPVIVSDHCAVKEIIEDGEEGFIVKTRSCDEIKGKIQLLYDNEELRRTMGKKAREKVTKYSREHCADCIYDALKTIYEKR